MINFREKISKNSHRNLPKYHIFSPKIPLEISWNLTLSFAVRRRAVTSLAVT